LFFSIPSSVTNYDVIFQRHIRLFENGLGTSYRAPVDGDHLRNILGGLDKTTQLPANTGKAKHFAELFPGQLNRRLV